jgi:Flp pilus assembly protein TadG
MRGTEASAYKNRGEITVASGTCMNVQFVVRAGQPVAIVDGDPKIIITTTTTTSSSSSSRFVSLTAGHKSSVKKK